MTQISVGKKRAYIVAYIDFNAEKTQLNSFDWCNNTGALM